MGMHWNHWEFARAPIIREQGVESWNLSVSTNKINNLLNKREHSEGRRSRNQPGPLTLGGCGRLVLSLPFLASVICALRVEQTARIDSRQG
jgi:hypothetical protein